MSAAATEISQYLTFQVGQEEYGIGVQSIKEILELIPITQIPRTPQYMKGVINVRGSVVPVIDMRLKFGIEETESTVDTSIIVLELALDGSEVVMGALVDKVDEVIELGPEQIEPAPRLGTGVDTEFLKGMGKRDDQFIMILDAQKVFSAVDMVIARDTEAELQTQPEASG